MTDPEEHAVDAASGEFPFPPAGESTAPVVVRQRSEHSVSRRDIDDDALKVLYHLSRQGYTAYLVGGGVRDLLLGRRPKDFDIGTSAHPNEIRRLFRNCFLIGRRFRLAHIRFGTKVIETSTFRRQPDQPEQPEGDLYHHRDNTFGTPEEDARRRDFTINGLFYDIRTFSVIDHVGGLEDLDRRLVRSIGDANVRFREDPVRMLRAVRFAARLNFAIEGETYAAILRHHGEIAKAAPPRLLEEIYRLFAFRSGHAAFRLLNDTLLLSDMFPEIAQYLAEAGEESVVLWRMIEALDDRADAGDEPPPAPLMFSVLLYPLFAHRHRQLLRGGQHPKLAEVERHVLLPVAQRFHVPKRVYYEVLHVLDGQRHFEGAPRDSQIERFARHEGFRTALALREIYLAATGGDLQSLAPWLPFKAHERRPMRGGERPAHRPGSAEGGRGQEQPSARRRGRRRRGGRRHSGEVWRPGGEPQAGGGEHAGA